jgi:hypothetical protein
MRLIGLIAVAALVALLSTSATVGADMRGAAKKELQTAQTHAGFAAKYNTVVEVELHLHHVVNCLEGPQGKNFDAPSKNVCEGQGAGIFQDLKDSGMAGAHALPYAELADQVAIWGIQQTMAKDLGRARAAANVAMSTLQLTQKNFK